MGHLGKHLSTFACGSNIYPRLKTLLSDTSGFSMEYMRQLSKRKFFSFRCFLISASGKLFLGPTGGLHNARQWQRFHQEWFLSTERKTRQTRIAEEEDRKKAGIWFFSSLRSIITHEVYLVVAGVYLSIRTTIEEEVDDDSEEEDLRW
jgi:hypothetical protein